MEDKTKLSINQVISERRTIHQFVPDNLPDKSLLLNAIECACWAPNHHLTQPWHFYLLGPKTSEAIVRLNADLVRDRNGEKAAQIKSERWSKIPGWLVLTCKKSENEIRTREDYAACCCAAQNMMLYLWNEGVGVKWTTGEVIREKKFYNLIHVKPEMEFVVGLFWYGYAEVIPNISRNPFGHNLTELP